MADILKGLNDAQKEAVENYNGPSLIIAGAGSGKTRVLTHRIANMLCHGVDPSTVLALTFTNKASKEMKERISSLIGEKEASRLWMGTFHSVFIRFLRIYAEKIGFPQSFTIYDTSDTKSAIKGCMKDLQIDPEQYKPGEVLSRISKAKNNLITPEAYARNSGIIAADTAAKKGRIHEIYTLYAKKCRAAGAMDFDDILLYMNILLRDNPDVADQLRERFRYILVDEYQDTNYSQYLIIRKLSSFYRNICVVGDDAQSIYGFRGARIENILNFKKDYPDAAEFRLEQNYRSTRNIVDAANSLIAKNTMQLKKQCFSEGETGERIHISKACSEQEEGFHIASSIMERVYRDRVGYSSFAVLYRTNAQSRAIEEALRKRNIPYRIYSGQSFYDRAEVKNMLAYLRLVVNPKDDEAFKRIVNFPARGIGETTMGRLGDAAKSSGISLRDAVMEANLEEFGLRGAAANKLKLFVQLIDRENAKVGQLNAYDLINEIYTYAGIAEYMRQDTSAEGESRLQNVEEFLNSVKQFCEENESETEGGQTADISVSAYLENVSLMTDMDRDEDDKDREKVVLMTVHASKGLEFPYVYIAGMEDSLFPSVSSTSSDDDVEEERRLFYVALTRAEKAVMLSFATSRFKWGSHMTCKPSRFLSEIDSKYRDSIPEDDDLDFDDGDDDEGFGRYDRGRGFGGGRYSSGSGSGYGSYGGSSRYEGSSRYGSGRPSQVNIPSSYRPTPLPARPADPSFKADPVTSLYEGAHVEHDRFGKGTILSITGKMPDAKAVIRFEEYGEKTLLLKFAKIRIAK